MRTAKQIIKHFEGKDNDITEIVTSASFLEGLGWDFLEAYDGWKSGRYSGEPYTTRELESYEAFLSASKVHILIQDAGSTYYAIVHNDRSEAITGFNPTGDDEQTLEDISENLDSFHTS